MSYRMFMGMLYLSTEQRGISAETFATIALSNTKIWSYGPVIKTVCSNNLGVLHRLAYVWILISVIYLLLAGTMIDLMTGYQSGEATWVGTTIQATDFIITDHAVSIAKRDYVEHGYRSYQGRHRDARYAKGRNA